MSSVRRRSSPVSRSDGLRLSDKAARREQVRHNLARLAEAWLTNPEVTRASEPARGVTGVAGQVAQRTRAGRRLPLEGLRMAIGEDPVAAAYGLAAITGKRFADLGDALTDLHTFDEPNRFSDLLPPLPTLQRLRDPTAPALPLDSAAFADETSRYLWMGGIGTLLHLPRLGWRGQAASLLLWTLGTILPATLLHGPVAGAAALAGGLTITGLTGMVHAQRARRTSAAEQALFAAVADGRLSWEDLQRYVAHVAGECVAPEHAPAAAVVALADALAQSAGPHPERAPHFSTEARGERVRETAHLISLLPKMPDQSHAWHALASTVSMGLMHGLNWQPRVSGLEHLDAVAQAQQAGARIVFVANHRSYHDIPAALALLRDFAPAIVAKQELLVAPWVGHTGVRRPWALPHWPRDGALAIGDCIVIDRESEAARRQLLHEARRRFDSGRSLLIFGPGTRDHTPVPGLEYGLSPFTSGMINIAREAAARGEEVLFVPIHLVGLGSIFGTDLIRFLRDGLRMNQPVTLGVGAPIRFSALQAAWEQDAAERMRRQRRDAAPALADAGVRPQIRWLTRAVWAAVARGLLPLQRAAMADEAPLDAAR